MPDGTAARRGKGTPQEVDRNVARRMRERRIMLGPTQQQVAERIGVTYQQTYKYEKGENCISAGCLHRIAQALGVSPGYFFEGLGTERPPEPRERRMPKLARDFLNLPSRRHREAVAGLARAFAAKP